MLSIAKRLTNICQILKGLPLFAMDIKYTQDIAKAIAPPKCYIQLKAVRT